MIIVIVKIVEPRLVTEGWGALEDRRPSAFAVHAPGR